MLERRSLNIQIYDALKSDLISGRFEPGENLQLQNLAESYGVSQMPVRYALSRLVSENALEAEKKARASVHVPGLSQARFEDLKETRKLVEGRAVELAAASSSRKIVDEIRLHHSRLKDAVPTGDISAMLTANFEFHFSIYRSMKSRILLQIIETLWLQAAPYFRVLFQRILAYPDVISGGLEANERIIKLIEEQNPEEAGEALRKDIELAARFFLSQM